MLPLLFGVTALLIVVGLAASLVLRLSAERRIEEVGRELAREGDAASRFDASLVTDVPEPGRRHLLHALEPGTPLTSSVRLDLPGSVRMSREGDPLPMESKEILAAGRGYVWAARMKKGPLTIRGFDAFADGRAEMRWWLAGVVPVVRADGEDVARSAAGRLAGASALFLPSTLLPSRGARWEAVDESTARVRLSVARETVELTLEVNPDGSLRRLSYPRWNSDPKNGPVGYLPFVTDRFAEERTFDGHTFPTEFRAGWRLGEEEEFPFFFARVAEAEYR